MTSGEAPLTVSFIGSNSTDDAGIVFYDWDFGDGITSTEADPEYIFNSVGENVVTLIVTDAEGLIGTTSLTITVDENSANQAPVAIASADVTSGEAPLTVSFIGSNSTDDAGIVSYAWDFGDGATSAEANPEYIFNTEGEYEVTLTVTDAEGLTASASFAIIVNSNSENQAPVAIASSDVSGGEAPLTVTFIGSDSTDDSGIVSFAWDFGDGGTSTDADPEYVFTAEGEYEVMLMVTDAEGLEGSTTLTINVEDSNEPLSEVELDMVLSPNPSIDFVEITLNGIVEEEDIIGFMLHDSAGRLIRQYTPDEISVSGTFIISLDILTSDVYVVTVILNNDDPVSKRLILRK